MKHYRSLYLALSSIIAVIPSVKIYFLNGLLVPPHKDSFFGLVATLTSAFIILLLMHSRGQISKMKKSVVRRYSFVLLVCGVFFALLYLILANYTIIELDANRAYLPLVPSGELAQVIDKVGGRFQAVQALGLPDGVEDLTHKTPIAMGITTVLLLITYATLFSFLTAAFCLLALNISAVRKPPDKKKGHK